MPLICSAMSPVALAVCSARLLTSEATTAKPRPASPARAASMVAFSASRLVCPAIELMSSTTSPMRLAASESWVTRSFVCCAWVTASLAIPGRLLHLPADLVDGAGHLLARRGDGLDVRRRLVGGGRNRRRQLLGLCGGSRQRVGGGFELRGRGRDGLDDLADGGLEIVGQLVHVGLPLLGALLLRSSAARLACAPPRGHSP